MEKNINIFKYVHNKDKRDCDLSEVFVNFEKDPPTHDPYYVDIYVRKKHLHSRNEFEILVSAAPLRAAASNPDKLCAFR